MTRALAYLSNLCRRWGGELVLVSADDYYNLSRVSGWTSHPLGFHAINVAKRTILANRKRVDPGTVIHEMGHVFLAEGDPRTTFEPDWLGWEIVLARRARCYRTWSAQNAGYELGFEDYFGSWGELDSQTARRLIAACIADAKALGIVSRDGEPLCTRKP